MATSAACAGAQPTGLQSLESSLVKLSLHLQVLPADVF